MMEPEEFFLCRLLSINVLDQLDIFIRVPLMHFINKVLFCDSHNQASR